jgi:hypothetical protein
VDEPTENSVCTWWSAPRSNMDCPNATVYFGGR